MGNLSSNNEQQRIEYNDHEYLSGKNYKNVYKKNPPRRLIISNHVAIEDV